MSPLVDEELSDYTADMMDNTFPDGLGISDGRFKLVIPENAKLFPPNSSLTAIILSSPKTIRFLKKKTRGRPCYIIPGIVGNHEITLSSILNVPLICSNETCKDIMFSESRQREFLAQSEAIIAPVAFTKKEEIT
ncbi:hypothetical protein HK096_008208 [Nowakowskiella sp. JEL0078]|nr:hypothetical protein HK096_008208 [Nowakowskiella sp. JEL0078]